MIPGPEELNVLLVTNTESPNEPALETLEAVWVIDSPNVLTFPELVIAAPDELAVTVHWPTTMPLMQYSRSAELYGVIEPPKHGRSEQIASTTSGGFMAGIMHHRAKALESRSSMMLSVAELRYGKPTLGTPTVTLDDFTVPKLPVVSARYFAPLNP